MWVIPAQQLARFVGTAPTLYWTTEAEEVKGGTTYRRMGDFLKLSVSPCVVQPTSTIVAVYLQSRVVVTHKSGAWEFGFTLHEERVHAAVSNGMAGIAAGHGHNQLMCTRMAAEKKWPAGTWRVSLQTQPAIRGEAPAGRKHCECVAPFD